MRKTKEYHITQRPDGNWQYKEIHNTRATGITTTQSQAVEAARVFASNQSAEGGVPGRKGQNREKNSYGNDTFSPKG